METSLERITRDLKKLATFNETPGEGVTRSAYSKEDREARNYLISEMKKLDLDIYEDGFSTLFGRREGKNPDAPVIMIGSHYDTVYHGGAFDGTAGVVAALETMRVLTELDIENKYPIELLLMNAEEGETFGPSTGVSNSRAMVGTLTEEELRTVKNRHGQTKLEAMKAYGVTPNLDTAKRLPGSLKNFIELHIEQGPILEQEKKDIGLVEYIPGIGRFKIFFRGRAQDSTALMANRKDALVAASQFVLFLNEWISSLGKGITGTVGQLSITPNSNQFVPHEVIATVEIRTFDTTTTTPKELKDCLLTELANIQNTTGVETYLEEMGRIGYSNPTNPSVMNAENVEKMKSICEQLGYSYQIINNGTGHDAMMMTEFVPTNMIYVPSKNGITHHPDEWTDYGDVKKGADILLHLVADICK
ncbi:Zn-dependent hydrolase [Enterococcus saccharolyticus]|uniref:Zn-dependent hydrolase n=1 Tax=Enterococcus saccharolyticus TaxID=41997 RepID=UPI001E379E9B|nr:Zn-dependent hydrolase [Enterococcus saccharolyticus]MCD5002383.1 Zn-dependent hydrolase [Enterococcus saccharolyticus]